MNRIKFLALGAVLLLAGCAKEEDPIVVSSVAPLSGDFGDKITITGKKFDPDNTTITFAGNKTAGIVLMTEEQINVKVPVGALTGTIDIKVGGKHVSTDEFTVTAGSWTGMTNFNKAVDGQFDFDFNIGGDGYIYLSEHTVSGNPVAGSFWMYNANGNTWSQKQKLGFEIPAGSTGSTKAWGTGDKGYILFYDELWEYDPIANEWTLQAEPPVAINGNSVHHIFYVSSVDRTYAIVSGGKLYSYNQTDDVWGFIHDLPFATALSTATGNRLVQGTADKGYFIFGKVAWSLNPTNNQWAQLPDCPGSGYNDFSFGIDNNFYVGEATDNKFWVYKSATNSWVQKAGYTIKYRQSPVYFTLNNSGYMGLGVSYPGDIYIHDLNKYIP